MVRHWKPKGNEVAQSKLQIGCGTISKNMSVVKVIVF